jgi:hypothetical protein
MVVMEEEEEEQQQQTEMRRQRQRLWPMMTTSQVPTSATHTQIVHIVCMHV